MAQILPIFDPLPPLNGQLLTFYMIPTHRHVTKYELSTDPSPPLLVHLVIEWPLKGPAMPKRLERHSMINIDGDLYLLGGGDIESNEDQKLIYKLTCKFRECNWITLDIQLKVGRISAVAIPLSDSFCE